MDVLALARAISIEPRIAPSMRANASRCAPPSVTAMFIGTSMLAACARARSIIAWAAFSVMVMLCPPPR
jgi:hypothetical protein